MKLKSGLPPLSAAVLQQLRTDAADVRAAADRKNFTLGKYEEYQETAAAKQHFQLGAWLYYYSKQLWSDPNKDYLQMQVECLLRLFQADMPAPGYRFFTVFEWGERQTDTIFEMGNSAEVLQELRAIYFKTKDEAIARAFVHYGWQIADERQLALFE